jgi:hypothetical protein
LPADAAWDLIEAQITYPEARAKHCDRTGHFLEHLGEALFRLILLLVGAKLWLMMTHPAIHPRQAWFGLGNGIHRCCGLHRY